MLLPSDLSPEDARAGKRALELFPELAHMVLHAFDSPGMLGLASVSRDVAEDYRLRARLEGMEQLRSFARDASLDKDAVLHVELGHPAVAARSQARDFDVDLVVLRPSRRWLRSGVTGQLMSDPPCDLLLMQ